MEGRGHLLLYSHWPDAPWNHFRGKFDQWAGTLAVQIDGIYEGDMLPWILSILFIINCLISPWSRTLYLHSWARACPIVLDFGRPNKSGSIRSIKMYSWAQCTMQEGLVCSRDILWGAGIWPPRPEVLRESTYPPPYLPEVPIGGSVYQQPGTRVDRILSQQGGFPSK
jgi:hypothetical protein